MIWLLIALMFIMALFVAFIYLINKMDKVIMRVERKEKFNKGI